jgi:signal peptidase I
MNEEKRLQDTALYESRFHYKENRSNTYFFASLLVIFWLVFCLLTWWRGTYGGVQVSGPSMLNTLTGGDYLLMEYHTLGEDIPHGSIIVVDIEKYPEVQEYNAAHPYGEPTKYIIKRLIAKEGDTVRCQNGVVEVLYAGDTEYTTLFEPYARYSDRNAYDFVDEYVVGEGEIFFLGDNRNISLDSRLLGLFEEDQLVGKVEYKLNSLFDWEKLS